MASIDDLKELIEQRGVRRDERRTIVRDLEQDRIEALRERMDRALEEVRLHAGKLRKALE